MSSSEIIVRGEQKCIRASKCVIVEHIGKMSTQKVGQCSNDTLPGLAFCICK